MDPTRTLVLGSNVTSFETGDLFSNVNFYEFSAIVLQLEAIESELLKIGIKNRSYTESSRGRPAKVRTLGSLARLGSWLAEGHILVVITSSPFRFEYGAASTAESFDLSAASIFQGMKFISTQGQRIEFCGPAEARPDFDPIVQDLQYETVLEGTNLKPLFKVSKGSAGSAQVVGGYRNVGTGLLIVAPGIKRKSAISQSYYEALIRLTQRLRITTSETPVWLANYRLKEEDEALNVIQNLKTKILEIEDQITEHAAAIQKITPLKQLFFASGDQFVEAVASALRELGLTVIPGPHPRADLLAFDGKTLVVVECKGLEGSAREINLRQTEKWVADARAALASSAEDRTADNDVARYWECIDELLGGYNKSRQHLDCKGLMVLGTFRKTPLQERGEDFPDPVARPINRSQICALTGLHLLSLILRARANPKAKTKILQDLLSTNGVIKLASTWSEFLITPKPANE